MKHLLAIMMLCATFVSSVHALVVEESLQTPLRSTEQQAFVDASKLSREIATGKNEDAMGEASIECPEDNHPSFVVMNIRINSFWLTQAQSVNDKRYSGTINYALKCSHDRSGGGDR